jgi:hypothetical protein
MDKNCRDPRPPKKLTYCLNQKIWKIGKQLKTHTCIPVDPVFRNKTSTTMEPVKVFFLESWTLHPGSFGNHTNVENLIHFKNINKISIVYICAQNLYGRGKCAKFSRWSKKSSRAFMKKFVTETKFI